jgi:hypothetical protein
MQIDRFVIYFTKVISGNFSDRFTPFRIKRKLYRIRVCKNRLENMQISNKLVAANALNEGHNFCCQARLKLKLFQTAFSSTKQVRYETSKQASKEKVYAFSQCSLGISSVDASFVI